VSREGSLFEGVRLVPFAAQKLPRRPWTGSGEKKKKAHFANEGVALCYLGPFDTSFRKRMGENGSGVKREKW